MFRMRGGTAMAVRDGQPLLRDKNLGKGYGGRLVSILCRGCETAPETVAEEFPFFDNKGGTPLVLLEASLPTEQDNGDWRLGSGAPVLAKQKYGSWEQTSS